MSVREPAAISLLIPCYNAAKYLPRLIGSVRAGTMPFAAIRCYDDGSTDDTVAVARSLGLEIITGNPNRGVAHARNRLGAAARTEWIHFHDADDLIGPQFVERLGAQCREDIDVVSSDADWLDEDTRQLLIAWRFDAHELKTSPVRHLLHHGLGLNNTIVRRSAWDAIGGCDEELAIWEDADVHIRLAAQGSRFAHVPEVHSYSLRHADSFSHNYVRNIECRLHALRKYATTLLPDLRTDVAQEVEIAADGFITVGSLDGARRAVAFALELGLPVPGSSHPLMRVARKILPALALLRLRHWWRSRAVRARQRQTSRART